MATELDYLESPYLVNEYLTTVSNQASGLQFSAQILDKKQASAFQTQAVISKQTASAAQFQSAIARQDANAFQFLGSIQDSKSARAIQHDALLVSLSAIAAQFKAIVETQSACGFSALTIIEATTPTGLQANTQKIDFESPIALQFSGTIEAIRASGLQVSSMVDSQTASGLQFISNPSKKRSSAMQAKFMLAGRYPFGLEFQLNPVTHAMRTGYLQNAYLLDPYLAQTNVMLGLQRFEFEGVINAERASGFQFNAVVESSTARGLEIEAFLSVERASALSFNAQIQGQSPAAFQLQSVVESAKYTAFQVQGVISTETPTGMQIRGVNSKPAAIQFLSVLYNTTNLRILWRFPSRGTGVGSSWTANTTDVGDYGAENLNTSIVEQKWRSSFGVKNGIKLICDTGIPQGVFMDTLAILGHNFTTSAAVTIEADNDPLFGSPDFTYTFPRIEKENLFYIAPELPIAGYRYWRISIDDATNTNDNIEIGTIVFGQATIWTGECFSNPVRFGKKHYVDQVFTEGYTNVSNDRGIKKTLSLDFNSIDFNGGNYSSFQEMLDEIRTNYKALWIPTPKYPSRYAIFGKLTEIPDETHNDVGENADYVNFSINVDEAK